MLGNYERTEADRGGQRRKCNGAHSGRQLRGILPRTMDDVNGAVDAEPDEHRNCEEIREVELDAHHRHQPERRS